MGKAWLIFMLIFLSAHFSWAEEALIPTDPRQEIKTQVGERVVIVLKSNKSTGYEWRLIAPVDEKMLKLLKAEYFLADNQLVGAGGKEVWTFEALKPGKTMLSFKYIRSWEKKLPPADQRTFVISIQEKSE
jgi:inhibitor of cysteine peptidase